MRKLTLVCMLGVILTCTPSFAHDWYNGLMSPVTGGSCCNEKDCKQTLAAMDDNGDWWVFINGMRRRVPTNAILKTLAPDGNSHVCVSPSGSIVCFIQGQPKI